MVKHKNNTNELYPPMEKEESKILAQLDNLLVNGDFEKIIAESEKAIINYPDNRFFYIMNSIAHSQINQKKKALEILKKAEEKFPIDYEVLFQLAKLYEDLKDFLSAEKYYKKSYELTPKEFKDARSDCLNNIGALYWELNLRDTALEYWQLAVKEYPKNTKAVANLKNCSNKYGEPVSVDKLFDDMYHFKKIQSWRYFQTKKKKEFTSEEEVTKVIAIINDAWNKHIAPEKEKLDNSTVEEINKWFDSIDLDFSNL